MILISNIIQCCDCFTNFWTQRFFECIFLMYCECLSNALCYDYLTIKFNFHTLIYNSTLKSDSKQRYRILDNCKPLLNHLSCRNHRHFDCHFVITLSKTLCWNRSIARTPSINIKQTVERVCILRQLRQHE